MKHADYDVDIGVDDVGARPRIFAYAEGDLAEYLVAVGREWLSAVLQLMK